MIFLAGLFGGIGVGVLIGFILGARAQRQLGLIFKIETERVKARMSPQSGTGVGTSEESIASVGLEHPSGPPPPTPSDFSRQRSKRKDPMKWWTKAG